MTIYERIKMLRQQAGMSQDELARKSGYEGRSMISRIEAGQIDLQLSKVEAIAKALGVNAAYLAGFDDHQHNRDIALSLSYLIDKAQQLDDVDLAKLQERADMMLEADKNEMQTKKGPLMCANIINDPAGAGEKAKETPPPLQRSPH